MRILKYKSEKRNNKYMAYYKYVNDCPYHIHITGHKPMIGSAYCKIKCNFNITSLYEYERVLCTADEYFEPGKKYRILLIEKSY